MSERRQIDLARYCQDHRERFLAGGLGPEAYPLAIFRKRARIVARQIPWDFVVETDRGPMVGHAGDYLVTNHPDDDSGSDLWTISRERLEATYELVDTIETGWVDES